MKQWTMERHVIEAHMKAFESAFNALVVLQDQWEVVTNKSLDQGELVPEEFKKAIRDWIEVCRKGREDYRQVVEDSYQDLVEIVTDLESRQ